MVSLKSDLIDTVFGRMYDYKGMTTLSRSQIKMLYHRKEQEFLLMVKYGDKRSFGSTPMWAPLGNASHRKGNIWFSFVPF